MRGLSALFAATAAVCVLATADVARAQQPVTIDDVLSMSAFGATTLSPDGRWILYERQGPWESAPRFDRGWRSGWATSQIMIAGVGGGAPPEPLVAPETGVGFLLGPWSPDGTRLLIYKLSDERLEAGVVSLRDRSVRWTGLTPDMPITGSAVAWLDSDRLALTVRPDRTLPWMLRFDGTGREVMSRRWAATERGTQPSRNVFTTRDAAATPDVVAPALRLVVFDLRSGETRVLADGALRDMAASPDGKRIAFLEQGEVTALHPTERAIQLAILRRGRLRLVDVDTGSVIQIPELDVGPHLLRWSQDSGELLVWARKDAQAWSQGALRRIGADGSVGEAEAGDLSPLQPGRTLDEIRPVRADWLGDDVLLWARRGEETRFDRWRLHEGQVSRLTGSLESPSARLAAVAPDSALLFGDEALWRITSTGLQRLSQQGHPLAQGDPDDQRTPIRMRANNAPRRTWAISFHDDRTTIIDDSGRPGPVADGRNCAGRSYPRAATASAIAVLCLHRGVESLWVATADGERRVDRLNERFDTLSLAQPLAIPHRDWRGRSTESFLFMPVGMSASEVKGLLVHVYPGRAEDGAFIDGAFLRGAANPQLLTTGGYAVLSVALANEAESTRDTMFENFVTGIHAAVDATLDRYPDLPRHRMAVIGHSFGGYTALAVAARSRRFNSYISWAGPTDLFGMWGEIMVHSLLWPEDQFTVAQSVGWTESGQAGLPGPPWTSPNQYALASPYLQADRVVDPVLLITADKDYVAQSQAERMFAALHRQGKIARMVVYWGEGHDNTSPANLRDAYVQIFDWLEETIGRDAVMPQETDAPPRP